LDKTGELKMTYTADRAQDASPLEARPAARPPQSNARVNVLGVLVSAIDLRGAVRRIKDAVARGERGYICVCGVHGVIECRDDPALQDIHNKAMAVVPDGMPLVWALHAAGHADAGRVYGPDLMRAVFAAGQSTGMRHFLYGTTPTALARLEHRLLRTYPGCKITGTFAPPFRALTPEEEQTIAKKINATDADVVWVGLSTPKQEKWMAAMRGRLDAPVLIGVGAAFDFIGGGKRSAPRIMQVLGLEWLFRLASEPRRLWRRYMRIVPTYLANRALQKTGLKEFPTSREPPARGATRTL
jgi:N-acetylglucosaminyldiphosphoundecaprenol N-acetyl-beta-D-mannosaminyltransferase